MAEFLRNHPIAITYSIALHVAVAAALVLGFDFSGTPRGLRQVTAIQARVVDETAVRREMERIAEAEREAARREREQQRLADERKEQARQEQLRVQREDAARAQRERDAEAQREREAEQQRQAEQRKREEEARRQAEARKQAELEAELAAALAAEDEARRAEEAGLLDQYLRAIHDRIQSKWIKPLSAQPGLECIINVTQIPSGDVVGVSFVRCNGDDAVKRSIEAAVQAASPLPRPPVPALFNRSVEVTFKPEV
ncbi:MAG TPA: TonB C-terminal domain-containing protein [Gammaproteobacteria bacterium]|jgi:colicin import membrane protein